MNKNLFLIGVIAIIAVVAVYAFADPDVNPGTDTSGDHASETAQEHANDNAAFNRGDELLPDGAPCTDGIQCQSTFCNRDGICA